MTKQARVTPRRLTKATSGGLGLLSPKLQAQTWLRMLASDLEIDTISLLTLTHKRVRQIEPACRLTYRPANGAKQLGAHRKTRSRLGKSSPEAFPCGVPAPLGGAALYRGPGAVLGQVHRSCAANPSAWHTTCFRFLPTGNAGADETRRPRG